MLVCNSSHSYQFMALPFGIGIGEVVIGAVGIPLTVAGGKILFDKAVGWWLDRRRLRRERVRQWHSNVLGLLTDILSTGVGIQASRRNPVDEVIQLKETAVELRKEVDPFPPEVRRMVEANVLSEALTAGGLAFHLTHLPQPNQEDASIANLFRHQFEILERIGSDTDVTVDEVRDTVTQLQDEIEVDDIGITEEEADTIITEFESAIDKELDDSGDLTVDEIMELPWDRVDDVFTPEIRRHLVNHGVNQYYNICLVDQPRKAKSAVSESIDELFG